jgi:hypothetical protein
MSSGDITPATLHPNQAGETNMATQVLAAR